MAGFSNTFETNILKLLLNATAIANIADNASSSPSTEVWVSLHTADPTDTGTQGSNETAYTGYARRERRVDGRWERVRRLLSQTLHLARPPVPVPEL